MIIEENVPLAPLTTFKLGGAARFFARAGTLEEMRVAFDFAQAQHLRTQVLGGGSNVLVADAGFNGLVIKVEVPGVERERDLYVVGAGERWDALCERAVRENLWGIENLSGIPGTIGGAVFQNIGAYGAALSQTLEWVEALDACTGEVVRLSNAECLFGYRTSIFKRSKRTTREAPQGDGPRTEQISSRKFAYSSRGCFCEALIVLRAALKLSSAPAAMLGYRDLHERFAGKAPTLGDIRRAVLEIRAGKFPDLSREGTAGSYFLNPAVSRTQARALQERFPDMPLYDMPETENVKVPLGWLLDRVLSLRGMALGPVRLFEKQALVIAASRDARASDVTALAALVKKEVKDKIGLDIEEEVRAIS